ncbi:MAG TPA: Ig-like domain repeat protein [Bryobacteraceae bacterium]|nr:Ig-like domain repeat protein [Bryobacteraceae bacterium]
MRRAAFWIATMTAMVPQLLAQNCSGNPSAPLPDAVFTVTVNPSPLFWGQNASVSVNVSGICGAGTGAIELEVDGEMWGNVYDLDVNGNATIPIPDSTNGIPGPTVLFGSPGIHTVGVAYSGDFQSCGIRFGNGGLSPRQCIQNNYNTATSPTVNVTVNQANTTTSLTAATNGSSLTATVTVVAPGSGTPVAPTGTVSFFNNGTSIGSGTLSNGQVSVSVSGLLGFVTADYSGDINFVASTSRAIRVGPAPTSVVTISSGLNPSTIGQSVTFTASLAVMNGISPPTGTIQFADGTTPLGSPIPLTLGQATYTTSTLTVGSHTINATYSGDSEFPSAGENFGQVVNRIPTTLTLSSSPSAPLSNQTLTVTAQLGPQPPTGLPGPTGQVTFTEGLTQLGTASVSSGAASASLGPLTSGTHQVTVVYSGDADWSSARGTITITVAPGPLTITTQTLPGGTACAAYSTSVMASGGAPPYTFSGSLPPNLAIDPASGALTGAPQTAGSLTVTIQVTDSQKATVSKQLTIQAASGLAITTQALPNGTTGSPYSASVVATCGSAPLMFSGTLPANLAIDPASGAISGTPTVTGSQTVTVNVTDSAGGSKSATYTVTFSLPPVPTVTITGGSGAGPNQQPLLQVSLSGGYPEPINGTLTLGFKASSGGGDNPEVQFAKSDCPPAPRCVGFSVPATLTAATFTIGTPALQTGTVAGTITIAANITGAPTNPVATEQITIPAAPPTISVTAAHTSTGFTVTVTGFSTTLDMTQATFQFTAGSGTNLQTSSLTVQVGSLFSTFYQSAFPGSTGSQFVYTQPFNVTGGGSITSVTVTMTNSNGTSQSATATIQ